MYNSGGAVAGMLVCWTYGYVFESPSMCGFVKGCFRFLCLANLKWVPENFTQSKGSLTISFIDHQLVYKIWG